MIKTILISIKTGLHKLIAWDGWTDQDRTMIRDIVVQIDHLQRRREQREVLLQRNGR